MANPSLSENQPVRLNIAAAMGSMYFRYAILFSLLLKLLYALSGMLWVDGSGFFDVFFRNDSAWYRIIAEQGYPTSAPDGIAQTPFSFFPLYPALAGLFMQTGLPFHAAAFALSCLSSLGWIALIFSLLRRRAWQDKEIFRFLALFQLMPFHHFHHMFYSEQVSMVLMTGMLLALDLQHRGWVFALAVLLVLSRPTGLVYAATLPLLYLSPATFFQRSALIGWLKRCLPLLGAFAGLGIWMLYLRFHCGDALAFSHAQSAWDRGFRWPWMAFFNHGEPAVTILSCYALLLLGLVAWVFRRNVMGLLFHAINLLFPLSTGQIISWPRYASVNLPAWLELRNHLQGRRFFVLLAVIALLHAAAWMAWLDNMPVWSY